VTRKEAVVAIPRLVGLLDSKDADSQIASLYVNHAQSRDRQQCVLYEFFSSSSSSDLI
jgi:hypothetical protein